MTRNTTLLSKATHGSTCLRVSSTKVSRDTNRLKRLVGYDTMALVCRFLLDWGYPNSEIPRSDVGLNSCPRFTGAMSTYHAAANTYYASSDTSGVGGIYWEQIRATPIRNQGESSVPRYDCVLVDRLRRRWDLFNGSSTDSSFFPIRHDNRAVPCALVEWHEAAGGFPPRGWDLGGQTRTHASDALRPWLTLTRSCAASI